MSPFALIFFKIISILLSVIIGFIAGRLNKVERESIASLLFYFISPIVFFAIPASVNLSFADLSIAFVTFVLSSSLCYFTYHIYGYFWSGETRNILAMSSGSGNTGYFMLPIASTIFDDYTLSIYMMAVIGVNLYESSIGYYVCARSISSTRESIKQVLKLPMLHAFILGCLISLIGLNLPDFLDDFVLNMRGTYSILGMMMIGLGLSKIKKFEIEWKFTGSALLAKFFFYPLMVWLFIALDKILLHWYDTPYHNALVLLSSAPMAANTIVVASIMRFHPERVASAVLISCLVALVYVPITVIMFISNY